MIEPLRIAINAQLEPDKGPGGVQQALIGLIAALGELEDGPEEYVIIMSLEEPDWLKPYLGPNQRIVCRAPLHPAGLVKAKRGRFEPLKRLVRPLRSIVGNAWYGLFPPPPPPPRLWPEVPVSDGFYESLACHVIHFPYQHFVLCALPAVYNPHDLQHLHHPEFFTPSIIAWRETIYPAGCRFAHTIVVASQWVKDDLTRHYRVHAGKVQVIPTAPPSQAYPTPSTDTLATVKAQYRLQPPFAFYPATTWEHKNHVRLLEALALLRDRAAMVVRLVCTGSRYAAHWPRIEEHLRRLNLDEQVRFLGMVPPEDLRAIYALAQFVVIPTLFEAASQPLLEAWHEGVPVACSKVTSLPEQAGDAALLFDPLSVEAIADAVRRMATDQELRSKLISKGPERLADFSWERTAKAYRAVYRRAARRSLTDEDRWLLSWDWMRDPRRGEKETS